jgi:hypothetical protein
MLLLQNVLWVRSFKRGESFMIWLLASWWPRVGCKDELDCCYWLPCRWVVFLGVVIIESQEVVQAARK